MKIINIGCGTKTSDSPDVINLDWSIYLQIKSNPLLFHLSRFFLNRERLEALNALPDAIVVHDLRKGIPFEDASVDAVYHSHFLEHLDRTVAPGFLKEVHRVLKPGGIHRMVVPDMEKLCADYLAHLHQCQDNPAERSVHDDIMGEIIEQMVRREAFGTSRQKPFRRWVESRLLGDARKRGETHQWMYDRINLPYMLENLGYQRVSIQHYDTSHIPGWNAYGLDQNSHGGEYKPGSLYVEAIK